MRALFCVLCVAFVLTSEGRADDLDARAAILRAEMTRDAAALHPWLKPDAPWHLRSLAVRALGRIGDDGTGPGILRDLLATATPLGEPHLMTLLWAAGQAQTKELAEPLMAQVRGLHAGRFWDEAAQAVRALGWTRDERVLELLRPLLASPRAELRAAALEGLARAGAKGRDDLMAASAHATDPMPQVRAAADFACWMIAGRHARAAKQANASWDGDAEVARRFVAHLADPDPDRRLGGVRVLGPLLPQALPLDAGRAPEPGALPQKGTFAPVHALLNDADARVAQEAVARIFARRRTPSAEACLIRALAHADPKVREAAATALGERESEASLAALKIAEQGESDLRMREVLARALVGRGDDDAWKRLAARTDRHPDPVVRQTTEALVLLGSKREDALEELFAWADPGASQRAGGIHAAVWMTILSGLEGREHPRLDEWLTGFLAGGYAVDKPDRHFVIASAVSLVGGNGRLALAPRLLQMLQRTRSGPPHDEVKQSVLHEEIRAALMGAFADLAGAASCPEGQAKAMREGIVEHLLHDPSPWVRRAAKEASVELAMEPPEYEDPAYENTWAGLPAVEDPLASGVVVKDEPMGGRLDEKRILMLADWMARERPLLVFKTTQGTIEIEVDAEEAPVHSVSLLNAVRNGVYTDTRWHRVVPSFVIQGGDPHGHGGGGGGWTVPDEITRHAFVRGALGMPKSTKDDGGCQLFIMHSAYPPLDGRYTCYGRVVSGMHVVDRIRVGDRIESAHVVRRGH